MLKYSIYDLSRHGSNISKIAPVSLKIVAKDADVEYVRVEVKNQRFSLRFALVNCRHTLWLAFMNMGGYREKEQSLVNILKGRAQKLRLTCLSTTTIKHVRESL